MLSNYKRNHLEMSSKKSLKMIVLKINIEYNANLTL